MAFYNLSGGKLQHSTLQEAPFYPTPFETVYKALNRINIRNPDETMPNNMFQLLSPLYHMHETPNCFSRWVDTPA